MPHHDLTKESIVYLSNAQH